MNSICLYFEVHQPFRIRPYGFFEIGHNSFYLDQDMNRAVLKKVAEKCYLPATKVILDLIHRYKGDFRVTFSLTGTVVEQLRAWYPEVLEQFKRMADTGHVEFLAETYYHSLSSLYSEKEFRSQVAKHMELMREEFGVTPSSFRNTELIFSDRIANLVSSMGFRSILLEGTERVLGERSPNFIYSYAHNPSLVCMLKNYRLSDDIAFRFSDKSWPEYPLNAEKFSSWVHSHAGAGETLNLFMDFETFGEHQWASTGIFEFLRDLPKAMLKHPDFVFRTVSESARRHRPRGKLESRDATSWTDTERDLSAWVGNAMQNQAIQALYKLEEQVYASDRSDLIHLYGLLQSSDHFYYMSTKHFNDGAVHKYFSPYRTPYDAYVYYMNILQDFRQTLESHGGTFSLGAAV